jgi:hypothetical protein
MPADVKAVADSHAMGRRGRHPASDEDDERDDGGYEEDDDANAEQGTTSCQCSAREESWPEE